MQLRSLHDFVGPKSLGGRQKGKNYKQERQCAYEVPLRLFRLAIFAVKIQ